MLRSGDDNSITHLDFWLGSLLADVVPGMGLIEQARDTPEYFSKLGDTLEMMKLSGLLTATSLTTLSNRMITDILLPSQFLRLQLILFMTISWFGEDLEVPILRLGSMVPCFFCFMTSCQSLPMQAKDGPFRIGVRLHPYSPHCPGAEVAALEHFYVPV